MSEWLLLVPVLVSGAISIAAAALVHHNTPGSVAFAAGHLALVGVGVLILTGSVNRVAGWLLVALAVAGSVAVATNSAAIYLVDRDGVTIAARILVSTSAVLFAVIVVSVVSIGLTFPDGRLLSPRWRPVAWLTAIVGVTGVASGTVDGWVYGDLSAWLLRDDWSGTAGLRDDLPAVFILASAVWDVCLLVSFSGAAVCLLVRLRRSRPHARRQIRWVVFAGVVLVAQFAISEAPIDPVVEQTLPGLASVVAAGAFAVAVLRHGLWDVELVVRRSLVYGVLWGSIAAFYVLVGTGLGIATTARLPIWIAIAITVATTVVFEPARRRLEVIANRFVFGSKPDPIETIGELSQQMGTVDELDDTASYLAEAAARACDLAWVEVRLSESRPQTRGTTNDEPLVEIPIGDPSQPVGSLRCQGRVGDQIDKDTQTLLGVLAAQTALGVAQAGVTSRLAHASAEERRRLERNLHDGTQQDLVALMARLGLARATANGDAAVFDDLQRDVQRILADLRTLAQGIHPSVLTDAGLSEAVRECADRLPLPIRINVDPTVAISRPHPDIEAAAYFMVSETLTNTVKHARATRVTVNLSCLDGLLRLEITDDGTGFDPHTVQRRGLAGIEDRITAHGGTFRLASEPATGTTVIATIPTTPITAPSR